MKQVLREERYNFQNSKEDEKNPNYDRYGLQGNVRHVSLLKQQSNAVIIKKNKNLKTAGQENMFFKNRILWR